MWCEFRGGIYAINASAGAVVVCTGELCVSGVCDRPSVNQIMSVYKVFCQDGWNRAPDSPRNSNRPQSSTLPVGGWGGGNE